MRILFLGDFCPQMEISLSERLSELIKTVDFSIVNLEGFFSDTSSMDSLSFSSQSFEIAAKRLKIKLVSVANNHSLDGGKKRFSESIGILDSLGIIPFGTVETPCADIGDVSIWGVGWKRTGISDRQNMLNTIDLNIRQAVEKFKQSCGREKFKVIFIHWGVDLEILPLPFQVRLAIEFIEAGADLIIGHHSHLIQPIWEYRGKKVFFSIGNVFMPRNNVTYYYPSDANKGLGIILDTKTFKIRIVKLIYSPDKGFIDVVDDTDIKYLEFVSMKDYKKYFSKKRVKRIYPIYTGSKFDEIKVLKLLIPSILMKTKMGKKLWKKVRKWIKG